MKSYYLPKRRIYILLIIIFIVLVVIIACFVGRSYIGVLGNEVADTDYKKNLIYHGNIENNNMSFAVNVDWGEEYIPAMLDIFAQNDIQSTFFLTGRWCENNPDLAKEIYARGHEIGNHAYSHKSPNAMTFDENLSEIERTYEVIKNVIGTGTTLYAPPSGECEKQVYQAAQESGHQVILWTADTIDWQKPEASVIIKRILSKLGNGVIVLMHPTENTVEALPAMIKEIKKQGYNLVDISTNIGL